MISCGKSEPNACLMSEDFIKKHLNYPAEAEFPMLDCNVKSDGNGNYTVLRKITAKNAFGVKSEFIYKVEMYYNGAIPEDINNWTLMNIKSEEVK
ncbi:MAG: hypothetical protein ACRC0E_01460 [Soonwooa sp.]